MIFARPPAEPDPLRVALRAAFRMDEGACLQRCWSEANQGPQTLQASEVQARRWAQAVQAAATGLDGLLRQYRLSPLEALPLLTLAEALLRLPDGESAARLLGDSLRVGPADHDSQGQGVAARAGLRHQLLAGLVARIGEPRVRQAVRQAMRLLAPQLAVVGRIGGALTQIAALAERGYRCGFDLLGESAVSTAAAERNFERWAEAIQAVAAVAGRRGPLSGPWLSLKLSALHPRFHPGQRDRLMAEGLPRLKRLVILARRADLGLCFDGEEAARLEPLMDLAEVLAIDPDLAGWQGLGFAVHAYHKGALPLIDWLLDLAGRSRRRLLIRLEPGGCWHQEIARSRQQGSDRHSVYTRRAFGAVSYLGCAHRLLASPERCFPAFVTHDPVLLAAVCQLAADGRAFELQRGYGMAEALYAQVAEELPAAVPRVWLPVGDRSLLLTHLARQLLAHGAGVDESAELEHYTDPVTRAAGLQAELGRGRALPGAVSAGQLDGHGPDLHDLDQLQRLKESLERAANTLWQAEPMVAGDSLGGHLRQVTDPANRRRQVGIVFEADTTAVELALTAAMRSAGDDAAGDHWAAALGRAAALFERHQAELLALLVRESGKTLRAAVAELRAAVEALRHPRSRPATEAAVGPQRCGPGAVLCLSPSSSPLAALIGQVSAVLASGKPALAKPSRRAALIATRAVQLLHQAGVSGEALQLLPGEGAGLAARLLADPRVAAVLFAGAGETAERIRQTLAQRPGREILLLAETVAFGAVVADASARPQQLVRALLDEAFRGIGPAATAPRLLCLDEGIAEPVLELLAGAVAELAVGDPGLLATDVGPLVDATALARLEAQAGRLEGRAYRLARAALPADCQRGWFFAPRLYELDDLGSLEREVSGPLLQVLRYRGDQLEALLPRLAAGGETLVLTVYGGDATLRRVRKLLPVGSTCRARDWIDELAGR